MEETSLLLLQARLGFLLCLLLASKTMAARFDGNGVQAGSSGDKQYVQNGGRFEEAKQTALGYMRSEQFDRAAGKLEEVWEQDKADPMIGENLAIAYLNTEDRASLPDLQERAFAIMRQLRSRKAPVSFIVHHSHEKLALIQGRGWHQYCSGKLTISQTILSYFADKGKDAEKHSFEIPFTDIRSAAVESAADSEGAFRLNIPKGSYLMSVRNRNHQEAEFLVSLIRGH